MMCQQFENEQRFWNGGTRELDESTHEMWREFIRLFLAATQLNQENKWGGE